MKGVSLQVFGLILALLGFAPFAQAAVEVSVCWEYYVVSTPDLDGAFRGNAPGFRAPVPKQVSQPKLRLYREKRAWGSFEAIVGSDGRTTPERSRVVSGPEAKRRINEILKRWRFESATLDDQPIRVRIRITILDGCCATLQPSGKKLFFPGRVFVFGQVQELSPNT